MTLCLYPWPLTFYLAVPEDCQFGTHRDGKDVKIRCIRAEGARIFSFTGTDYAWLVGGSSYPGYMTVMKNTDRAIGGLSPFRYAYFRGDGPRIDGVVERVSYTWLEIAFEIESADVINDPARLTELRSWVARLVEDFVDYYRLVSQDIDVRRPRAEDLVVTKVMLTDDYTIRPDEVDATFYGPIPIFHPTNEEASGHGKPPLPEEKIDQLAQLTRHGVRLPLFWQFLFDAKEQARVNGQYDLAIVLIATAFESFIRERLITVCEAQGRTDLAVGKQGQTKPYRQAIEEGDTRRELLEYVKELSGTNVKATQAHNAWYDHAFKVRHQILHRAMRGFGEEDAGKAFDVSIRFMGVIDQALQRWLGPLTPVPATF